VDGERQIFPCGDGIIERASSDVVIEVPCHRL
jgi:hypothetical protein